VAKEDLLPPNDGDNDSDRGNKGVTCDFCKSRLTRTGEVLRIGSEAKAFQKAEKTIEELRESLAQAEGAGETYKRENETLKARVKELETPGKKSTDDGW
jgi:hypothetical protein